MSSRPASAIVSNRVPRFLSILFLLPLLANAQDFIGMEVQRVVKDVHFAEGPQWSYEGYLLFSDTVVDKLRKLIPGTGDSDVEDRPGGTMGNAYDTDGRLYTCEFRQRRVTRAAKNGKVDILAARFEGKRLNGPNDIIVRRDGQIYFTDPAFGSQQDTRELDFYGVFHITPRGEIEAVARWKTRPNGIALSPNGRILYVADSDERLVRAYDLDNKGVATKERVVIDKISGVPGGLEVDEKGNLYVAAQRVYVYATPTVLPAKLLGEVPVSEPPSNIAFGDPDLETLYITARTAIYRVRLGVKGALQY